MFDSLQPHESQHGQASLSITNSRSSLRLTFIESEMPSSHLIFCHSLLLLPPIPPSIRVFSNESTLLMRWLKYWSFSFSIIPSKEIPGLISFRMDWLDLLDWTGVILGQFEVISGHLQHKSFQLFTTLYSFFEGNDNPLQYSCLETSKDRGAWGVQSVHGITKSWAWLSKHAFLLL